MSPITNNYQYYEGKVDERSGLDFTKGREYNEDAVNNWYQMLQMNQKLKIEWGRVMSMIQCFEITYGRYLNDTAAMFKEADENKTVLIPREKTPTYNITKTNLHFHLHLHLYLQLHLHLHYYYYKMLI
jgi:hypothetical protein